MKAAIIAGCVSLLLATGATHANSDVFDDIGTTLFDCKDVLVQHVHLSDMETYRIEISVEHKSRKRPPVITFDVKKETLIVNGKPCKGSTK